MLRANEAGTASANQFSSTARHNVGDMAKAAVHRHDYVPFLAFYVFFKGLFGEGVTVHVAMCLGKVVGLMEAAMIQGDLIATIQKPLNDQWPGGARTAHN